ncbi:MAG: tetratricopeptide repeat protein [Caulobacteraceae bacterium]
MSTQSTFDAMAPADNAFESWARSLCEFVIRAAILPVTLFFTKPSALLRATETGEYRPLPSPFLLALITGVVMSGVTSNISKFRLEPEPAEAGAAAGGDALGASSEFLRGVVDFYMSMNGVNTILYAIPYVFVLWAMSGLISLSMFRGIRTAEALMTAISLSLSALVELTILLVGVSLVVNESEQTLVAVLTVGFLVYTLVIAIKLIRFLFVIRKERGSHLIGAIFAAFPALLIVSLAGLIGAALSFGVYMQRGYIAEAIAYQGTEAYYEGQESMALGDYPAAIAAYDRAIAANPSAEAYNSRCWARAVWGQELDLALEDCNASLQLAPDSRYTLDSRALVRLRMGDFEGAVADYDEALRIDPAYAHALYGRGIAKLRLGRTEESQADLSAALAIDPSLEQIFASYGVTPAAEPQDPRMMQRGAPDPRAS